MLLPHLQGFDPQTLSSIVWDTINCIGVHDQREHFGIHFDELQPADHEETEDLNESSSKEEKEGKKEDGDKGRGNQQIVNFWD